MTSDVGKEREEVLAKVIADYWAKKGKVPALRVEKLATKQEPIYQIRSDMLYGMPR
jgi:hypothetical protein